MRLPRPSWQPVPAARDRLDQRWLTELAPQPHHGHRDGVGERVWDEYADPFTNAVAVTVMRLRRKLGQPPLIETVTGSGYRLP